MKKRKQINCLLDYKFRDHLLIKIIDQIQGKTNYRIWDLLSEKLFNDFKFGLRDHLEDNELKYL